MMRIDMYDYETLPYLIVRDQYNVTLVDCKQKTTYKVIKGKRCYSTLYHMYNCFNKEKMVFEIGIVEYKDEDSQIAKY